MPASDTLVPAFALLALWLLTSLGVWIQNDGQRSIPRALWGGAFALVKHSLRFLFWIGIGWAVAALVSRRR